MFQLGATNEKALERRAFAYFNMSEKYEKAIEDYKLLQVNSIEIGHINNCLSDSHDKKNTISPFFFQSKVPSRKAEFQRKIVEINEKVALRNEAMKADMMEKLKGLGNMCLSPFGLSTDSFEMTPNGNGGFSVQMKGAQNKKQ